MKKPPKKTVAVSMSQDTYAKLKQLSVQDTRSVPSYIRQVLRAHLDALDPFSFPDIFDEGHET